MMQKSKGKKALFQTWLKIWMSGEFDRQYYLRCNKDVADLHAAPIWHFVCHGAEELRDPSENFDISFYLQSNPDVKEAGVNPFLHYIQYGKAEGRRAKPQEMSPVTESPAERGFEPIIRSSCDAAVLVFDHCGGGGTSRYLFNNLITASASIQKSLLVHYDLARASFIVQIRSGTEIVEETSYTNWGQFIQDIGRFDYTSIIVDSLVNWPSVQKVLEWISAYKRAHPRLHVEYKGHDYHCICPSYTLLDYNQKYCGIRCDEEECAFCVRSQGFQHICLDKDNSDHFSVSHWREIWGTFLTDVVDRFEVFSPAARKIFSQAYPDAASRIELLPHEITPFTCCNVAILGHLSVQKGSEVVRSLCKYLDDNQVEDMQLYLFGQNPNGICSPHLMDMGPYKRNELPEKLRRAHIDIVFISSVCPETFCYTAGESIALGYPTACFNMGGQADQVSQYEKGIILSRSDPSYLYETFIPFATDAVTASLPVDGEVVPYTGSPKTVVVQDKKVMSYLDYLFTLRSDKTRFVPEAEDDIVMTENMPRVIASYLPQFHDFPENIKWFGKGFSEWTNTSQTVPQFIGHRQPHVPVDLGYYNLQTTAAMHRQAELARKYGVSGFAVYYYWFSGHKLMDQPLRQMLADKELDFPFFLFWANDDWTMAWGNGATRETLFHCDMHPDEAELFMTDVLPYMKDPRYIRIHNKPVLLIYKIALAKKSDYLGFVQKLQTIAKREGLDGLYLIAPIEDYKPITGLDSLEEVQKEYRLDALMEFHPIAGRKGWVTKDEHFIDPSCRSTCYDVDDYISNRKYLPDTDAKVFPGLFPDWDNSPRRYDRGAWILQNSPENYKKWLSDLIRWSHEHNEPEEQLIFVNAWNEWAEGAHLEPDTYYGYAYLQKTREALEENCKK